MAKACIVMLLLLLVTVPAIGAAEEDDPARKAYLLKRAEEKAAAEQTVRELSSQDQALMGPDDCIRLSLAYNEIGDHRLALEAVCRVADDLLALKKQLDLKAICFHNVNSGDDKSARIRELAFIDRCLDRKYDNQGVWLWRKAKLVCQSSTSPAIPTRGDEIGSEARILDREQYEYAFELLTRAFEVEPKLFDIGGVGHEFTWEQDFPLLSKEARFQTLMRKARAGDVEGPAS
jgi:hypothetical protein